MHMMNSTQICTNTRRDPLQCTIDDLPEQQHEGVLRVVKYMGMRGMYLRHAFVDERFLYVKLYPIDKRLAAITFTCDLLHDLGNESLDCFKENKAFIDKWVDDCFDFTDPGWDK